jgi:hypothetical protein
MSIATVDDLTALDPGVEVIVTSTVNGKATWAKTEDGRFRHVATGAFVKPEVFIGSVAAGAVVLAGEVPPEVGEVYRSPSGTYWYLILAVVVRDGATTIHTGRFRNGAWYGLHRLALSNFDGSSMIRVPVGDLPAWWALASAMATVIYTQNETVRERDRQIMALQTQPVPERFVHDLHRYAGQVVDDEFDTLLSNHGIGRTRPHTSVVAMSGTVAPDITETVLSAVGLGANFEIENVEVGVSWSRTTEFEREGIGCTCGEITEEMIRPFLPPNYRNLEWSAECA